VIGVDVGGTKVAVAVVEGTTLHEVGTWPTDTDNQEELLQQFEEAIREALPASAVGLAVPSVVDFETGAVRASANIPLAGVPLRAQLTRRLGVPVYVDNDATCAGLAEAYGDDHELLAEHLIMVTVGTGVGGGIIVDGRIFRGATGAAAEIGHTLIGADLAAGAPPAAEHPPQPGSLEALASGRALGALAKERGFADGKACVAAAKAGDPRAADALRVLGERLGVGIANLINTFDPTWVVVGGGVSAAGDLLLEPARRTAAEYTLRGVGTRTEIRLARYGNQAGVRGAALLAAQELAAEEGRDAREGVLARRAPTPTGARHP
jgi:glucokinase